MLNKFNIIEIIRDSKDSLKKDINGYTNNRLSNSIVWVFIPIIISFSLVILGFFISDKVVGYLITGLSIFAGLFFSLLMLIIDKANKKKEKYFYSNNEEDANYLKRYLNFSKQLISKIAHCIIISILIIIVLFCTQIYNSPNFFELSLLEYYKRSVVLYLTNLYTYFLIIRFVILLFIIVSEMYAVLYEELK